MVKHTTMRTVSGVEMDLLNPDKNAVYALDIAYSLARIMRFTGHTTISVAQHSVEVMLALYSRADFPALLPRNGTTARKGLLYALLHDAHEAYTGDISRPMNNAIGAYSGFTESPVHPIKRGVQKAIHDHFDLKPPTKIMLDAIAIADRKLLNIDRWLFTIRASSLTAVEAQGQFLRTLETLLLHDGASFVGQFDDWPGNENEQPETGANA